MSWLRGTEENSSAHWILVFCRGEHHMLNTSTSSFFRASASLASWMINTTLPGTTGLPLGRGWLVENSSIHPLLNQVWFGEVCLTFVVQNSNWRSTVSSLIIIAAALKLIYNGEPIELESIPAIIIIILHLITNRTQNFHQTHKIK